MILSLLCLSILSTGHSNLPERATLGPYRLTLPKGGDLLVMTASMRSPLSFPVGALLGTPRLVGRSKVLVLGLDGSVAAVSTKGEKLWSRQLDYVYNPGKLVALGETVIYDNGPNHIPLNMSDSERTAA